MGIESTLTWVYALVMSTNTITNAVEAIGFVTLSCSVVGAPYFDVVLHGNLEHGGNASSLTYAEAREYLRMLFDTVEHAHLAAEIDRALARALELAS